MKSAKVFLAGMYLHLALSIILPFVLFGSGGWNNISIGYFMFYVLMLLAVLLTGWIAVIIAITACASKRTEELRKSLKILKIYSIPFYILNFLYSVIAWFFIIAGSRGILFFLIPIPIIITLMMVVQGGCVGACYLKALRGTPEGIAKVNGIHYVLQFVTVIDVISTIIILKKTR